MIIDAELTHDVGVPFDNGRLGAYAGTTDETTLVSDRNTIHVLIEVDGRALADGPAALGSRGTEFSFPLSALPRGAQTTPYNLTCTASYSHSVVFMNSTLVHYLPPISGRGSITKMNLRTGGLLVKADGKPTYEPIIPFGYYTSTNILGDKTAVQDIKVKGCVGPRVSSPSVRSEPALRYNLIHPIPPFANETFQSEVFDAIDEAGEYYQALRTLEESHNNPLISRSLADVRYETVSTLISLL